MRTNHEAELRGGPLNFSLEWQLSDRLIALPESDRAKEKEYDQSYIKMNEERGSPYNHLGTHSKIKCNPRKHFHSKFYIISIIDRWCIALHYIILLSCVYNILDKMLETFTNTLINFKSYMQMH